MAVTVWVPEIMGPGGPGEVREIEIPAGITIEERDGNLMVRDGAGKTVGIFDLSRVYGAAILRAE